MKAFTGALTGQTFESEEAMNHYERVAAQRLAAQQELDPFDDPNNSPDAESIKRAHEFAQAAQSDQAREIADQAAAQVFLELHPEYKASPKLANAFETYFELKGRSLDQSVTVEQLEEAADFLTRRGLIEADAKALAAERKNEVQQMADEVRQARRASGVSSRGGVSARTVSRSARKSYAEDDLYNMSLDELRALALKEAGENEVW